MNKAEFVNTVKEVVRDDTVKGIIECYEKPPGRNPSNKLKSFSNFYHSLSEKQKNELEGVMTDALDAAIFGFFCVLDGVRSISTEKEKTECELFIVTNGKRILINDLDSSEDMMHDIYQSLTYESE